MNILKLTNIGIKVGGITLPIIRVVCNEFGTVDNADKEALLNSIMGFTTTCAYMVNSYSSANSVVEFMRQWTTGATVYGDDSGFKLSYSVGRSTYSRHTDRCGGVLYYKGLEVCRASIPGFAISPGVVESDPFIIFTDENYNIAYPTYSGSASALLNFSYADNGGVVQVSGGNVIARLMQPDYSAFTFSTIPTSFTLSDDNIKDDITGEIDPDNTDPYGPGGNSGPGGGTGDFDGTSDEIPIPGLPTLSATSTGFITLFNPSAAQLRALADYMWSNSLFDIATWKKIFADPMDAILGLSIVPVAVPVASSGTVSIGNISTDVSMPVAATQYIEVDCGTLNVNEYWGAYLDYDPYTKAEIYLPYIGTHALSVDDIMGKAVHVVYHIDILSGACAAFVQCGDSVLYTFIGQCAASIPISGNDWTNVINGAITAAASIGSMVATGGASAPLAVPALASTAANSMKPNVEKSGSMSGAGGMLSIQSPYLILTRPRQALPFYQNGLMGYPSFMTETLGDLTGYTEVEYIHLENVPCTENEAEEILEYLHGGVII